MRNALALLLLPAPLMGCADGSAPDDERLRLASAAMASGNTNAAIEIAADIARVYPADARARLRHAEMLAAMGRWPQAAEAFARAVAADRTLRAAHLGLGRARLRGGDLPGAQLAFREAIAALPLEADAQSGLGVAILQSRMATHTTCHPA